MVDLFYKFHGVWVVMWMVPPKSSSASPASGLLFILVPLQFGNDVESERHFQQVLVGVCGVNLFTNALQTTPCYYRDVELWYIKMIDADITNNQLRVGLIVPDNAMLNNVVSTLTAAAVFVVDGIKAPFQFSIFPGTSNACFDYLEAKQFLVGMFTHFQGGSVVIE
jgi:hypothetical protein